MNFSSGEFILIRKSFKKFRIKFIFVVIVFISIILLLDFQFRPMIKSVAISKSRTVFSEVINEAVLEDINNNPENYKEVVNINKNEVGEVLAVSSDIEKINSLKSNINLLVQKKLCNLNQKNIYISLEKYEIPRAVTFSNVNQLIMTQHLTYERVNMHQIW